MEFYYAQLNEENICIGVSQLAGEVTQHNMMRLKTYDTNTLGKKYTNGEWVKITVDTIVIEPTEQEIVNAQLLLTQQEIMTKQEILDGTLALILLNQQGV